MSQYLLGKIPLNLPALLKFAGALGVSPDAISPAIASQLPDAGASKPFVSGPPIAGKSAAMARLMSLVEGRDEAELERITQAIEILLSPTKAPPPSKKKVIEFTGLHPKPADNQRKSK